MKTGDKTLPENISGIWIIVTILSSQAAVFYLIQLQYNIVAPDSLEKRTSKIV